MKCTEVSHVTELHTNTLWYKIHTNTLLMRCDPKVSGMHLLINIHAKQKLIVTKSFKVVPSWVDTPIPARFQRCLKWNFGSALQRAFKSVHTSTRFRFWSSVNNRGTNLAAIRCIPSSFVKIRWQVPYDKPKASQRSLMVCQRSSRIFGQKRAMFSSFLPDGRSERSSSSTDVLPSLNRLNHS